jgi:effector-binding domain-containing protein
MNYQIHVKQIAPQTIVTERKHAVLSELGHVMQSTLTTIAGAVQPSNAARGAPFAIYHNEPFRPDDIDVEMGVPIAGDAKVDEARGVHRRELSGGAVAYTIHDGAYASIGAAYDAVYKWIRTHGHTPLGPPREIYLVGPGEHSAADEYRTEIEVPID